MKRHRVLFVNHVGALAGAEYCCLAIATAYRQTSHMLLFEDGGFRQALEQAGVTVTVVPAPDALMTIRTSSGLNSLKAIPALWQMATVIAKASRGYDVICANSQKAFIASALATLMGAPPLVWHLRDILTAQHFSSLNRRIAIALANWRAAQVWTASQATADAFIAVGGRKDLVKVVYDGIAVDRFEQVSAEQAATIREELNLGHAPLVGLFSRLSPWKGQHILIEALRELPDVHALMVGDALFGEDEYVAKIKTMASDPALAKRIHWLGFRHDIPALMAACNIIVHASTEPEPCARIAVEGQLSQRPVIVSAGGGMFEVVEDGYSGCLFPPGNAQALAKVMQEILENPSYAETLASNGKKSAQEKFSPERCLDVLEQAMTTVVS
jgi:glycosyltransferase involved in cell wall biosynthesis